MNFEIVIDEQLNSPSSAVTHVNKDEIEQALQEKGNVKNVLKDIWPFVKRSRYCEQGNTKDD